MTDEVNDKPIVTEEEVWSVLDFARGMGLGANYLNPFLVNNRLQDITLNPMQATQDGLDKAMLSPKTNEKELQAYSEDFELRSMIYKKLISYLANMLSFDVTYTSEAEPSDYSTPKYKKDLKTIEEFLNRFDYKKEFRVVIKEMLRNDAYFGCLRDVGDGYVLQELPSDYCKITGRWSGGFLFSFNMYWFLIPGTDLNLYPDFFKKKYKELFGSMNNSQSYNPALPPEMRGNSSYVYWVDIPVTVGACFKLTPELAARLPYFTPMFNDLIMQTLMRNLQKNMNMAAASKMIIGEIPMLNKEIKATVKDSLAISPDLLGKFMALVKSAISEAIKMASAPLQNIQGISFDSDTTIYDTYLKTTLAQTGINTNLIFSSNIKPNTIETQLSLNVDEQMMTALYQQFNSFMNYSSGKLTRHFKFMFEFEGTDFFLNRDKRLEVAMNLFNQGIVMPQKISAAIGMKPAQFRKHMEESAANGFMALLTPPSIEQQRQMIEVNPALAAMPGPTGGSSIGSKPPSGSAGRPKKPASKLSEEGDATRAQGTNISRGGKA